MPTAMETPTEALLDGRYRLLALVGRGGSANVYRAEDQMLQRTVAIKLLRAREGDTAPPERAYRETGILASLSHPALVTLLDAQLAPGRPQYLVMEYIDGPTLGSLLTNGPLPAATVAGIARDIASALEAVHAAGIVHRDVKPSNILLAPPVRADGRRRAKLTDFGISRSGDDIQVTSPGVVIGTAAYMAPEQVRCETLTSATDVYSLGLVLLEALTGEPAFPREGGVSTALARLTSSPEIPASLGEEWGALLRRMTDQDAASRPSAADVSDAASALAETSADVVVPLAAAAAPVAQPAGGDEVTKPLPDTAAAVPERTRRRGPWAAAAAVLAVLTIAAGVWAGSAADGPSRLAVRFSDKPVLTESPAVPGEEDVTPADTTQTEPADTDDGPRDDDSGKEGRSDEDKGKDETGKDDKGKDDKGENKGKDG